MNSRQTRPGRYGITAVRAGLAFVPLGLVASPAWGACPADHTVWMPEEAPTIPDGVSELKLCVREVGFTDNPVEIFLEGSVPINRLSMVGENPGTQIPALAIQVGLFGYEGEEDVVIELQDLQITPPDDTTPAVLLRSGPYPDDYARHMTLTSVSTTEEGPLVEIDDGTADPQVRFVSSTWSGDATPVSTCATTTTIDLDDNGLQPSSGARGTPLAEVGEDCTEASRTLILNGTLQESLASESVPGLVPDAQEASDEAFAEVELRDFTARDVHCAPCVSATSRIATSASSWQLGGAGSIPGGTLFSVPDGRVEIETLAFQTDGPGWRIAEADRSLVYRLDACMPGGSSDSAASVFHGSDLDLWNSVVVHPGQPQALWSSDEGSTPRLRGVSVVTAVDDGTAVTSAENAFNTLFVQPDAATGSPLPDGFAPPDDVVVRRYSRVFNSNAVATCLAPAIPDVERSGTRGKGRVTGPTGMMLLKHYCDEVVDAEGHGTDIADVGGACTDPTEVQTAWCDPDETWPDVGAWSGPLSDLALEPENPGSQGRPCPPLAGSGDTAVPFDTADAAANENGSYEWGGTCKGAVLWLPLALLPVWLRRRRPDEPQA